MANNITNICRMFGSAEDVKAVRKLMETSKKQPFDFEKLLPQPEELSVRSYPYYPEKGETKEQVNAKSVELIEKYGYDNWYEWSLNKWGTKWNSYDCDWVNDNLVTFSTDWSTPEGIWRELAKRFPSIQFVIAYADEDIGCNCGIIFLKGENFDWKNCENKDFSYAFALIVRGMYSLEEYMDNYGYDSEEDMEQDFEKSHIKKLKAGFESEVNEIKFVKYIRDNDFQFLGSDNVGCTIDKAE